MSACAFNACGYSIKNLTSGFTNKYEPHLLDYLKDFKTTNFKVLGDMFEGTMSHISKVKTFVVRMLITSRW